MVCLLTIFVGLPSTVQSATLAGMLQCAMHLTVQHDHKTPLQDTFKHTIHPMHPIIAETAKLACALCMSEWQPHKAVTAE